MSEQTQAQFVLQRIFIKDMSFESPKSPDIFLTQFKPKVNLEINTRNNKINEDSYEVILSVTITVTDDSDETIYLVEVQQAGIFLIKGMEDETLSHTLGSFCPNVLFPYVRENVDAIVTKGSFPPLMLAPVNFDAVYQQAKAQAAAQANPQ